MNEVVLLVGIAYRASAVDPAVAATILKRAPAILNPVMSDKSAEQNPYLWTTLANPVTAYAFVYRLIDPVESRLLLEEAYGRSQQPGQVGAISSDIVLSMAALDQARAEEMVREGSKWSWYDPTSAEVEIARFLLALPDSDLGCWDSDDR